MVTPEKAEQLAKESIVNYLHVANPLVAGDTSKLLMKMRGVIDGQIEELQVKAARRLTQAQPTIAIVDEGCWYPGAESQSVLSLGRTAPTHIHEVDASK